MSGLAGVALFPSAAGVAVMANGPERILDSLAN